MELTRTQIIINLINKLNLNNNYLEIGTQNSLNAIEIKTNWKVGVDPSPISRISGDFNEFHQITSDLFFTTNNKIFDLIFIDGLHTYEQSKKDFINAYNCLKPFGAIVMHDAIPHSEDRTINDPMPPIYNGDVFRTIIDIYNANTQQSGLGYLHKDDHGVFIFIKSLKNESFCYKLQNNHNTVSYNAYIAKLNNNDLFKVIT